MNLDYDERHITKKKGDYCTGEAIYLADPSLHTRTQDYKRQLSAKMRAVSAQDIAAPAVVIPRNHQHRRSRLAQVSERGEHPKARARDHRSPLEPKLEEIAVDDERTGPSLQLPEKLQYVTLHLQLRKAEMQVGNHIAW